MERPPVLAPAVPTLPSPGFVKPGSRAAAGNTAELTMRGSSGITTFLSAARGASRVYSGQHHNQLLTEHQPSMFLFPLKKQTIIPPGTPITRVDAGKSGKRGRKPEPRPEITARPNDRAPRGGE